MENPRRNWDFAQHISKKAFIQYKHTYLEGKIGGYPQLLFLQRCKALAGSKVGDKYLTFLSKTQSIVRK